jgi:hypothetical protein
MRSKQLSSLTKTDHYSTNFSLGSTTKAPKMLNESSMLETCTDEVCAISEDNGSDKEVDKPKKNVPQNLTTVTIMVVDTISSVRSRRLLKILLDSVSTITLVNKKCLPKKCRPCQISQSYQLSAMVVMHNLRLPELVKNRNVEQQKALIFESDTCKYDVILGADFLAETGIDVKYSIGAIEWYTNELPLCNPNDLKDKDFKAMAEIREIQQEVEFLVWISMTQPVLQLNFFMQNMKRFKTKML